MNAAEADDAERGEFLLFHTERQAWIVSTRAVHSVFVLDAITPMPLAPPAVAGLCNIGGEAWPVVDLDALDGTPAPAYLLRGRQGIALDSAPERVALVVKRLLTLEAAELGTPKPCAHPAAQHAYDIKNRRYLDLDLDHLIHALRARIRLVREAPHGTKGAPDA